MTNHTQATVEEVARAVSLAVKLIEGKVSGLLYQRAICEADGKFSIIAEISPKIAELESAKETLRILALPSVGCPPGWKMVPVEPTDAMVVRGAERYWEGRYRDEAARAETAERQRDEAIERAAGQLDLIEGGLILLLAAAKADDPSTEIVWRVQEELRRIERARSLNSPGGA